MIKTVIARLEVDGLHRWPSAQQPVRWLSCQHRHTFFITLAWRVIDPNREREIFIAREDIREALKSMYPASDLGGLLDFGDRSCEQVAVDLMDKFPDAAWCEVWEEQTGGGRVER